MSITFEKTIFDLLIVLDKSISMEIMEDEPIKAVEVFIKDFKKEFDGKSLLTFSTFNNLVETHYENIPLSKIDSLTNISYIPTGTTSLNDAICLTIKSALKSTNPNNKILIIITDGEENSSISYNKKDVKDLITLVESAYNWKVLFLGANINPFTEGYSMNINSNRIIEFNQHIPGNLLSLCKSSSLTTLEFTRLISENNNTDLILYKF